jgi:hypothetical protein
MSEEYGPRTIEENLSANRFEEDGPRRKPGNNTPSGSIQKFNAASKSSPTLYHPHRDQRPAQCVNERGQRPHIIGQFLALVAQGLNLGLGGGRRW